MPTIKLLYVLRVSAVSVNVNERKPSYSPLARQALQIPYMYRQWSVIS
jgi:hypothetical protein